jgi:membrane-associated protease RseP (regulator of RpoE activity)
VNQHDLRVLVACLPVFVGLLALQAVHELAHYVVAKARGIKIGLPLPLPSMQLGTFGCITPLRSFPPNRAALMDFALSGPVAAILLSLIFLIAGAYHTVHASAAALARFPVVPVALLKSSFLTGSLLSFLAPKAMMLPLSQPIPIHPLFMIGFSGILSSALNLLPVFRLDGGRACSAALGPRFSGVASAGTLLFMLSLVLSGGSGLAFAWSILVVFSQRRQEIPARDDVTEVDDVRLGAWIASLAASVLALAPFPGGPGVL